MGHGPWRATGSQQPAGWSSDRCEDRAAQFFVARPGPVQAQAQAHGNVCKYSIVCDCKDTLDLSTQLPT